MPQLSLYLDDPTMEMLRTRARHQGISLSRYASQLIKQEEASGGWPEGYWDRAYGCLPDFPDISDPLDQALDDDCDWF